MLRAIPLLAIPAVVYAMIAMTAGSAAIVTTMASPAFSMTLASGAEWVITRGHLVTLLGIVCLFFEILKSTRPTANAMIDNSLSVLVFVSCLVAFLLAPGFGTTEFFLIILMSLLDFLAGFIVMVSTARRTVDYVA
jgi:hypothetical protein